MAVVKLNANNFDDMIKEGTVLVDFYADWCGPCKMLSPIIDEVANERADVTVGKVNVDDEEALAIKFGVISIPTLVIFKNGAEHARLIGVRPKKDILAQL